MAWKRGTQNNLPGEIRKGHIKEFLAPTSKNSSVGSKFKVLGVDSVLFSDMDYNFKHNAMGFICNQENGFPLSLMPFVDSQTIYMHTHQYPRCVVALVMHPAVPFNCIVLNEAQKINNNICIGEEMDWTVYQGEQFAYDNREGALGDTVLRYKSSPISNIQHLIIDIRPRQVINHETTILANGQELSYKIARMVYKCILTLEELFVISHNDIEFVCRVLEILPDSEDGSGVGAEQDEETDYELPDHYRGFVDEHTLVFLRLNCSEQVLTLVNNTAAPDAPELKNIVLVGTSDDEVFPVKRRLLRPCIALTAVVQAGRGKYKSAYNVSNDSATGNRCGSACADVGEECDVRIDVDACTFDRVLLFLEHEARGHDFKFDPLLVSELREAAVTLGISALQDLCDKVLGSFTDRVRRHPIRLQEILTRNAAGAQSRPRGDTLLVMAGGMVLDITRWLPEHPGGSSIIPEQALGVDCTVFFEIYHASRQSFLYLKEFYIGELAEEDLALVQLPVNSPVGVVASEAFLEQLRRLTPWRLKPEDLIKYDVHKSF